MKRIIYFITTIITFTSCNNQVTKESQEENKGEISISGAFALYPLTIKWAEEFNKEYPDIKINITAGGAGKGMADVLSGMVDIAMYSKELSEVETDKGAYPYTVAKDAVVITINSKNPCLNEIKSKGVSKSIVKDLFVQGEISTWNKIFQCNCSNSKPNVFIRSDACGASEIIANYLDKKSEDLNGTGVFGDPGISEAVRRDINAIGYNNLGFAYEMKTRKPHDGIAVVPIDLNNNGYIEPAEYFYDDMDSLITAIKDGRYPSPPSRKLYFVTKEKSVNILVIKFIDWVLNKGQEFISEAGYVALPQDIIDAEKKKIK